MNWTNTSGKYFTASLSMSEVYNVLVSDYFAEYDQNQIMGCSFYNNQYQISACNARGSIVSKPEYFYTMTLGMA